MACEVGSPLLRLVLPAILLSLLTTLDLLYAAKSVRFGGIAAQARREGLPAP